MQAVKLSSGLVLCIRALTYSLFFEDLTLSFHIMSVAYYIGRRNVQTFVREA